MEGGMTVTKQELFDRWNAVQIKVSTAIAEDDWRALDKLTDESVAVIQDCIAAGYIDEIQQAITC